MPIYTYASGDSPLANPASNCCYLSFPVLLQLWLIFQSDITCLLKYLIVNQQSTKHGLLITKQKWNLMKRKQNHLRCFPEVGGCLQLCLWSFWYSVHNLINIFQDQKSYCSLLWLSWSQPACGNTFWLPSDPEQGSQKASPLCTKSILQRAPEAFFPPTHRCSLFCPYTKALTLYI